MIFTKEIKDAHAQAFAELLGYDPQIETPEQRIQRFINEAFDPLYMQAVSNFVTRDPEVVQAKEAYEATVSAKLEAETKLK